jgi:hypothetical protein
VATPAAILTSSAFVFQQSAIAWSLLRVGLLLWTVSAAFLLDERPEPVTRATPRSPTWWYWSRFLGGVPLLSPPIIAGLIWARIHPAVDPAGLTIQTVAAMLLVLAGATVASRLGRNTPGNLVASGAVLTALFLLIFPVGIRGIPLVPTPGDPKWDQSTAVWSAMGIVALIAIAIAGWGSPRVRRPWTVTRTRSLVGWAPAVGAKTSQTSERYCTETNPDQVP